ncbi:MAG TPA: sugar ABC transporter ATP-binding protein, partial [Anaerolineae bacterium]|nr:sugar ABC transporter ATP-binding protein [Anaerolineae bacterium]
MTTPLLAIDNISKRFGSTQALADVSLTLREGEIHALLGENGAGKSTLIKILTGIYHADSGTIKLNGRPIRIRNAFDAQAHGIAAIHQEPMIFPDLNVAENIFISHRNRGRIVNWRKMYRDAEAILARLDIKLDVRSPARGLTLAAQQAVEIAKAISLDVRVLIMDEPTASLSAHEAEQLFKLTRALREQGVSIVYISHRMEEVFALSDRISVLRDGKLISSAEASQVTTQSAIRDMVGRDVGDSITRSENEVGNTLL